MRRMKRTMAAYLTAAAMAVVLAAATATPAACQTLDHDDLRKVPDRGPAVELEIWMNRGDGATYREGEEVGIRFRTSRDCYVVIYDIDTEGFLSLLYPDDPYDDGYVEGGRIYRLPGPRADYDLMAEGPPGVEYVAAVASLIPIADRLPWYLAEGYEAQGYRGHYDLEATVTDVGAVKGDPYVAMRDIAYDILPERIHESEYDTDHTYFHVGRKYRHPRYVCYDCHGRVDWMDPYYDTCSVFEIRVDLDWHFISHPSHYYVAPRYWYWRRHDCPDIYLGFPSFWCSLYPRHYYRDYYWDGLYRVGLRYERRGYGYPAPRYRGRPGRWGGSYAGKGPRKPRYNPGPNSGGTRADGRTSDRKYGGRGKPDLPRDVKVPERLAKPGDRRLKPREGVKGRGRDRPDVKSREVQRRKGDTYKSRGKSKDRIKSVKRKSAGDKSKSKLRIVKKRDKDKSKAKVSKRKDSKSRSKSKAKVSKKKDKSKSKSKKSSARSGKSGSKKKDKAKKSSDRNRKSSSKSKRSGRSK
jgi:hypothetical protein